MAVVVDGRRCVGGHDDRELVMARVPEARPPLDRAETIPIEIGRWRFASYPIDHGGVGATRGRPG